MVGEQRPEEDSFSKVLAQHRFDTRYLFGTPADELADMEPVELLGAIGLVADSKRSNRDYGYTIPGHPDAPGPKARANEIRRDEFDLGMPF